MTDADQSSSSSEDFCGKPKVFYRDRPEWSDVTPVPQDDGPYSVVQIAYSDEFRDVFDYFRAILKSNEISERAFELTKDAANQNPANYTVWRYRRTLLQELKKDLNEELSYIGEVIEEHPKNYQNWYHRNVVVTLLGDASKELSFTERILKLDAKNYHAWQHRQWVVSKYGLWDKELGYTEELLKDDVRNNSAWSHRYYIVSNTTGFTPDVVQREFEFTKEQISKVPHNESAWNYLRGVLADENRSSFPALMEYLEKLYREGVRSFYLLGFMIETIEDGMKASNKNPPPSNPNPSSSDSASNPDVSSLQSAHLNRCLQLCELLYGQHDTIRAEYWKYLARSLSIQYAVEAK